MPAYPSAAGLLEQETRALLARLALVQPFVLQETSVPAAALSPAALSGIEEYLIAGRRAVGQRAVDYLRWLRGPGAGAPPAEQQRRFWTLRIAFQNALSNFDLFAEVITQRSEAGNGVMLSGLDVAAAEALRLPGVGLAGPPVVCSLHRGLGGAIRRAYTRLPGGGASPAAIIRIPRERIIGFGVASSLVHEVGHQGAAMLGLVAALRADLGRARHRGGRARVWDRWDRWISEIVADFWSIARIGVGSTLGLIALVSLPPAVVFRRADDDVHPTPWIRVLLSCAIGDRLYPDPQWNRLATLWRSLYPVGTASPELVDLLAELEATLPAVVTALVESRPPALHGRRLSAVLSNPAIRRDALLRLFHQWRADPARMAGAPPTVAFAVIGQARADGLLSPEREAVLLRRLITGWAVTSTLATIRTAAHRADTPVVLGQPAIWTDPVRPYHHPHPAMSTEDAS